MPFDYGLRLHNRQRLANARAKPIEANKNQSVDGAEGLFLRSGSPQNVYLLPQHPNFRLERCPRPKQICDHPNNEPDKISHPATASPDSRSTASQIEFAIGTGHRGNPQKHMTYRNSANVNPVDGNTSLGHSMDRSACLGACSYRSCLNCKDSTDHSLVSKIELTLDRFYAGLGAGFVGIASRRS
jgi:hypothetical protein